MKNMLRKSHLNKLKQNIEKQNIMEPSTTASMLTKDERRNVEFIKKNSWPKRNFHYHLYGIRTEKVKIKTKKVNKLFKNILTDNITKVSDLIYAGAKLVRDKIDIAP